MCKRLSFSFYSCNFNLCRSRPILGDFMFTTAEKKCECSASREETFRIIRSKYATQWKSIGKAIFFGSMKSQWCEKKRISDRKEGESKLDHKIVSARYEHHPFCCLSLSQKGKKLIMRSSFPWDLDSLQYYIQGCCSLFISLHQITASTLGGNLSTSSLFVTHTGLRQKQHEKLKAIDRHSCLHRLFARS